jgi:hypothetical protein
VLQRVVQTFSQILLRAEAADYESILAREESEDLIGRDGDNLVGINLS